MTTQAIAEITRVPGEYLYKVMQALVRSGIAVSQRGLYGGIALARPPEDISFLEVVNAVDPLQRIDRCPLGLKAHRRCLCPLHRRLDEALILIERLFDKSTIAELLAEPSSNRPLCEVATASGNSGQRPAKRPSKLPVVAGSRTAKER